MKLKGKTILITGAGGFIGQALVKKAIGLGCKVRGLEINPLRAEAIQYQYGIEVINGSILDHNTRASALNHIDIVIHTAAIMKETGSMPEFRKANVEAAYQLADEAKRAKVKVFVQLSSVMVYGFDYSENINEEGQLKGENNPYCQTKIEGEHAIMPLNDPPKFGVIVIRPGDVYGPGSEPWVRRPLSVMDKGLFALPDGGKGTMNLTYVDNLADGIFLAIENRAYGEKFNITDGTTVSWATYFNRLAQISGRSKPKSLPYPIAKALVQSVSFIYKMFGGEPPLSAEGLDFVMRPYPVSIEKAKNRLGFIPRIDFEEGMIRTKDWLNDQGLIR